MVVARGREDAKDMLYLLLRVLLARDGGDLGKCDLVAELGLVLVAVDGEQVRAEDDVDGLPLLRARVSTGWWRWRKRAARTFVLRVRFMMLPALMTRSNSKLPFWFTGDMTLAVFARSASKRGGWAGVSIFMDVGRMAMGSVGGSATAMVARAASRLQRRLQGGCTANSGESEVCLEPWLG